MLSVFSKCIKLTHRNFLIALLSDSKTTNEMNSEGEVIAQSLAVVKVFNMDFSVREEIIILTSIFCFAMFTIPIILIDASSSKAHQVNKIVHKNFSELEFRQKLLIESVSILESLNRHENKSISFSDLLKFTESEFVSKYPNAVPKNSLLPRFQKKLSRNVWKKFGFVNGTVLRSQSIKLPLSVDW